jgi:hypothetical protein
VKSYIGHQTGDHTRLRSAGVLLDYPWVLVSEDLTFAKLAVGEELDRDQRDDR